MASSNMASLGETIQLHGFVFCSELKILSVCPSYSDIQDQDVLDSLSNRPLRRKYPWLYSIMGRERDDNCTPYYF